MSAKLKIKKKNLKVKKKRKEKRNWLMISVVSIPEGIMQNRYIFKDET